MAAIAGQPPAGSTAPPLAVASDLSVRFRARRGLFTSAGSGTLAVDRVGFEIYAGQTLGVVGESGSGKSTVARMLACLLPSGAQVDGSVELAGRQLVRANQRTKRAARETAQMVFQDPFGSLNPRMSIGATLVDVLKTNGMAGRGSRRSRSEELLAMVGLSADTFGRYPHEFSGGQRQRVAIARALAPNPRLLVCDEPVSALDVSIQGQVVNLLLELQRSLQLTIVFVAHDIGVVRHVSDRIAVMYLGRVVESGDADVVYRQPSHPYTATLLAAIPKRQSDPATEHRERIVGDIGMHVIGSAGCAFRDRCWLYRELGEPVECRTARPQLVDSPTGSSTACHFPAQAVRAAGESEPTGHGSPADRG